jgi:hypothetical protein
MDHLAAYARMCLIEDIGNTVQHFLTSLHGKLSERLRDLAFCRQRLRHLEMTLDLALADDPALADTPQTLELSPYSPAPSTESFWDAIRQSTTTRVVLPGGETDLERAAGRFLASLNALQWSHLDQALQDQVLGPCEGLHRACASTADLVRSLAAPLVEEAARALGTHLPVTDVAQVEFDMAAASAGVGPTARGYLESAVPLIKHCGQGREHAYVLVPASDAGKAYAEAIHDALPSLHVVRAAGEAELMFCRDHGPLSVEDLDRTLRSCRKAYEELSTVPQVSPHARFDILDWVPLAP